MLGAFTGPTAVCGSLTLTHTRVLSTYGAFFAHLKGLVTGRPAEQNAVAFNCYPNPARETVQVTAATGATARLLDALGRELLTVTLPTTGAATFDVCALPPGLYTLVLRDARATHFGTRRVVVNH